jgi:hypothetical protein
MNDELNPNDEIRNCVEMDSQFVIGALIFLRPSSFELLHYSSLSQRRGYFRARRRLELESRRRDRRARLV